jgi:hypothetical protein
LRGIHSSVVLHSICISVSQYLITLGEGERREIGSFKEKFEFCFDLDSVREKERERERERFEREGPISCVCVI